MARIYEIHCYQGDIFRHVVARTNKFSEEKVREDVEKMNHALASEIHEKGIKYVFVEATGSKAIADTGEQSNQGKVLVKSE